MARWLLVATVSIAVLVAWVGSHRTADRACSADPPGITFPEHRTRGLALHPSGWHCVLSNDGLTVLDVDLGWWPTDPVDIWTDATNP